MNRFFKYALTTLCVATSSTAIAADWTPVFKSWENGCNSSSVEDSLLESLGYDYFDSDAYFKAFDNNGFFKLAGQKITLNYKSYSLIMLLNKVNTPRSNFLIVMTWVKWSYQETMKATLKFPFH